MTKRQRSRPSVTLKLATSLDGKIATQTGESKWITGPESRARVHQMRAEHDCVLTGIGTVLADDPELTARTDPTRKQQPVRAVLDSNIRISPKTRLFATAELGRVGLYHGVGWSRTVPDDEHPNIHRCYVDRMPGKENGLDLQDVLRDLQVRFLVRSIMVEAGARLAGAFLRAGLVDKLIWFRAPLMIGGDGLSVVDSLSIETLSHAIAFDRLDVAASGVDLVETYAIRRTTKGS